MSYNDSIINPDSEMPIYEEFLNKILGLAMLLGAIGNLYVFIRIVSDRKLRNINYFLICNLCFVDFLIVFFKGIFNEVHLVLFSSTSPIPNLINCYSNIVTCVLSIVTSNSILLLLAWERFVLIVIPFKKSTVLSARNRVLGITFFYIISTILLCLNVSGTESHGMLCIRSYFGVEYYITDLIESIVLYIIPNVILLILYTLIALKLYRHSVATSRSYQTRLVVMFFASSILKIMFWFPFEFSNTIISLAIISQNRAFKPIIDHGIFMFMFRNMVSIGILAAVINPYIYIILSPPMRQVFTKLNVCHFRKTVTNVTCMENTKNGIAQTTTGHPCTEQIGIEDETAA